MKEKNDNSNVTYLNNRIPTIKGDTVVKPAQFQYITNEMASKFSTRLEEISKEAAGIAMTISHYNHLGDSYSAKRTDPTDEIYSIINLASKANGTLLLRICLSGLDTMRQRLDAMEESLVRNVKTCELNDFILVEVGK